MFLQIEENEDDLPQTIRRMMDNEKYQRNIQGSMHYLEGEKSRLEVEREDTSRNRKWMKVFSILLLMVAASFLVLIFLVDSYTDMDTSWFTLLLIVLVAGFATLIFVLTSRNNSTRRKANRQLIRRFLY
jgi:cytosine/uracil/thiamine/allantoin permease